MACEVYDLETYKACFTYIGLDIKTEKLVKFVIHKELNQSKELFDHLSTLKRQIGFNNVSFDYPVLHLFLTSREIKKCIKEGNAERIIELIYNKAQEIIQKQNNPNKKENNTSIRFKEVKIPQLDLFRVWHYNNLARSTSLKSLEISMNFPNVMESSVPFDKPSLSLEEVQEVLDYNENDVLATYEFYKKTIALGKIDLRKQIREKYNLECINWDNGKIGENLILKLYCEKTGKDPYEVRELRTYYQKIDFRDCIPELINFKTPKFNEVLNAFKNKTIDLTLGEDDDKDNEVASIVFKDCLIEYKCGGIHGVSHKGIYESNDEFIIKSADVASLYPFLAICFKFYITHLGPEFLEVYENDIVNVRLQEKLKPKHEQDKTIIDGYKESANLPYGKSNFKDSFLYDPLYTYKTTVSGQLVLSMLTERLGEIPDITLIMINTDGLEVRIPRKYEDQYNSICKEWESETRLTLEFVDYQRMWVRDVNNYGCVSTTGKIKNKGVFEVDKVIGGEPAYHKDNSFKVVQIALQEYFINNIPVEKTITNHRNIYDFCGRYKFKGKDWGETNELKYDSLGNSYNDIKIQQKHTRYYISKDKRNFFKKHPTKDKKTKKDVLKTSVINKGFQVTVFNKFVEKSWEEYNINYDFFIQEAYKEIHQVNSKQISLF